MNKRPSLLNLDVNEFPAGQPVKEINLAAVEEAARRQGFSPRDGVAPVAGEGQGGAEAPAAAPRAPVGPSEPPRTRRERRVYRTGRTETWSVKASPEVLDTLYRVVDANGWTVVEAFERAVAALDAAHGQGRTAD